MTDHRRTTSDVFVDAVRDELNGTPHASHPVQFEVCMSDPYFAVCTLCGALVPTEEKWKNRHRQSHDDHNKVHASIEREALSYRPAPRYG